MNLIFFKNMSYLSNSAVIVLMVFNLCFSLPVPGTLYARFIADLKNDKCTLPSSISISNSSNKTVESSLQVCNSNEYIKYNKEVAILCSGTFELLKDIFCHLENNVLDKVEFSFSPQVCKDLEGYASVMPDSPLKHLIDSFTCGLLCTEDVQEACQVLWSSLSYTQQKSSSTFKEQLPSKNADNSVKKENAPDNNPKLTTIPGKQISKSEEPQAKQTDPTITKNTNEETPKSDVNSDITYNDDNNDESNKLVDNPNTIPEKYSVSKAIADQSPVATNNKFVPSANSTNLKTAPTTVAQNVNSAGLILEISRNQASDHSNTPNIETKNIETTIIPEQKLNPETTMPQKEKIQEDTPQEMPKKEQEPPVVPKVNEDKDDKNLQMVPTTEVKKEETKEVIHIPEEKPTNPKSDQPAEVSETSLSSEPSVVSVPAPKDATASPASPTPSLEKMEDENPLPKEKDTDQYTDLENGDGDLGGEYSKQEYEDNGMYEPSKSKEPVSESPKSVVPKEPVISERDELMDFNRNPLNPSRDSYGRGSEEIQVLATFPSQEDGHFFFYLLTIVLIFMAGYLVFHNKQKIIALIVEGRHERRRRSHGLGYRKLETK